MASNFVTTNWLGDHLHAPDLGLIDASWYLPATNRNGLREYLAAHIPGAVFFDIDAIADHSSGLPHMLPKPADFAVAMGSLGFSDDMHFVVYDGEGLFAAARVWWMLRVFGVHDVKVLEGGLPKWKSEGRPLESGKVARQLQLFVPRLNASAVADLPRVEKAVASDAAQIVDARSAARFKGEAPEPRPGVRSGHIPGSLNLPYTELIVDGQLKSNDEIKKEFDRAGIDLERPIITSCGSGVTAAILTMAAEALGAPTLLYDGSWSEWGSREDLPVATGPAAGKTPKLG